MLLNISKRNKIMKKYIILAFSFIFIWIFYSSTSQGILEISFCDVGQGDATLLSLGQTQVLIDTGKNSKVLSCLEHNIPFWDKKIEYLVLTHMDYDHIGGAPEVLAYYDVDFVFINPSNKKTSDFSLLEQVLSRKTASKTRLISTYYGQKIHVGKGLELIVIAPEINFPQVEDSFSSSTETTLSDRFVNKLPIKYEKNGENSLSIALKVLFKDVKIVLPGDLESSGELAIIDSGLLDKVVLLKAGHHGSKTSSNEHFIEVLQPEITVISSGKNNAYNHPNPQVVDTLTSFGVDIYQTMNSGEINFSSDGTHIWEIK